MTPPRARLPSRPDSRVEEVTPPTGTIIPSAARPSAEQHTSAMIGIVREEMRDLRARMGRNEGRVDVLEKTVEELEDERDNTKTGREKNEARLRDWFTFARSIVGFVVGALVVAWLMSGRVQCAPVPAAPLQIERKP